MDNPKPVPCTPSFSFSNRPKIVLCLSRGIPQPVSVTENSAKPCSSNRNASVMLPSFVNLVAFTSRFTSICCKRPWSVSISNEVNSVSKRISADVCLMLSSIFTTLRQRATTSCVVMLNFIFATSRHEISTTSLISLSSNSEFN